MPIPKLEPAALAAALTSLPGWSGDVSRIARTYRLGGFLEAMSFMSAAVATIHALDHHPEWSNVYDRVHVELTTHDAGGVTLKDIELAGRLERLASLWPQHGA
jgi:4a-hydroxytetrahydrobiopterin dehydratase